jgi:hypothetical protein
LLHLRPASLAEDQKVVGKLDWKPIAPADRWALAAYLEKNRLDIR